MPEFGLPLGASVDLQYDQKIADLNNQNQQRRQAKLIAENKAKMLADDYEYNNAMNAWDHEIVKNYSRDIIQKTGTWTKNNPDYLYNTEKRIAYKQMLHELKDNEHLNTGLQVDSNIKLFNGWLQDPKNADLKDEPETKLLKQNLENYLKTGSTDGITANRKIFQFTPPEEMVDLTPIISEYGKNANRSLQKPKYLGGGAGLNWQSVTDADKENAVNAFMGNQAHNRRATAQYKRWVAQDPETNKKVSINQYFKKEMDPFFQEDKYDSFHYDTKGGAGAGGLGKTGLPVRNLLQETVSEGINRAKTGRGGDVMANPDGLNQYFVGKGNSMNLGDALFINGQGNLLPFKGGTTKDFSFSGSRIKVIPSAHGTQVMASVKAQMPLDQFEQSMGGQDIFDKPTPWIPFTGQTEVRKKFSDYPVTITKDEKGNDVAEFEIWKPLDYNNESTHAAYNYGAHGKQEEFSSDVNQGGGQGQQVSYSALVAQYGKVDADAFVKQYGGQIQLTK